MSPNEVQKDKAYKKIMAMKGSQRKMTTASVQSKESCEAGSKDCGVKTSTKKVDNFYQKKHNLTRPIKKQKPIYEEEEQTIIVYDPPNVSHTKQVSGRSADEEEVITEPIDEPEYNEKYGKPMGRESNSGLPGKEKTKTVTKKKIVGWTSEKLDPKKSLVEKNSEKLKDRLKK
jgi:hypothetical protein